MTRDAFVARWAAALGDRWQADAPLAPLTTFKVGGPAEFLADISSEAELRALVREASDAGIPVTPLGGGSNVLVADEGIRGVVVRLRLTDIERVDRETVRAGAGVTINGLVRWTIGRGLAGLEAWAGTPGTVGGAIRGNAHWGGQDIATRVRSVTLAARDGSIVDVPGDQMGFAYDRSRIIDTGEIVVAASFVVAEGNVEELRARARASLHYRKQTQPLAMPSAGCIFQNPSPDDSVPAGIPRSAGALIDRAGLKGLRIGGARISERHANFIVNDGGATADDIRQLIERARDEVRRRFGVELRDEVVCLGTFRHG
ncbi:MAG: UDP-N-acetylmuramate dehydrogenase [Acidobacteriota bacterium]|jgi:UDP-N-acetylmuramate dehydrogenase|nr:MAG: UDP-N-acetylenolpyruvoylglucosamine reductase [Acidobacteriota bacterium]